jgi:hypothetical protein
MPTSLVSTGVQFPDNSIQTTAASASAVALVQTVTANNTTGNLEFPSVFGSYHYVQIVMGNCVPINSNNPIRFETTANNGSSYQTSNFGGNFNGTLMSNAGGKDQVSGWQIGISAVWKFVRPNLQTSPARWSGQFENGVFINSDANYQTLSGGSFFAATGGSITGFRIVNSGGNWWSGVVKVYGFT